MLENIGTQWNFDVFALEQLANRNALALVANHLFEKFDFEQTYQIDNFKLNKYFQKIENLYKTNPYHNQQHGTDVAASMLYFVLNSSVMQSMSSLDTMAVCLSGFCHDVAHPGFTNKFLVAVEDDLALLYNDSSVLENMHASICFVQLKDQSQNFLEKLPRESY